MSQVDRIALILKEKGSISNLFAVENKISYRLGARIWELRNKGWNIRTDTDRTGNAVYVLVSLPAPEQLALV